MRDFQFGTDTLPGVSLLLCSLSSSLSLWSHLHPPLSCLHPSFFLSHFFHFLCHPIFSSIHPNSMSFTSTFLSKGDGTIWEWWLVFRANIRETYAYSYSAIKACLGQSHTLILTYCTGMLWRWHAESREHCRRKVGYKWNKLGVEKLATTCEV